MIDEAKWDETTELTQRSYASIWKRLVNDKDLMLVAFRGAPYGLLVHWIVETQDYATCTGTACGHCKANVKKSARVLLNVFVLDEQRMMVFEGSGKTYETINDARKETGKKFESTAWQVTRHGAAGNTKTRYAVWPKRDLTPEELALIAKTPLHDLKRAAAEARDDEEEDRPAPTAAQPPAAAPDPDAKIAPAVVAEFRKRLGPLPVREKAYKPILAYFGCARLDEIRASDEHRARGLIEAAERGEPIPPPPPKPASQPTNELDEFA
jgi:hypothetical protein